jgi:hypothetical protein
MEAICSSKMSVDTQCTTWCYITEDGTLQQEVIGDWEEWRMCIILTGSTAHCGRFRKRKVV